VILLPCVGGVRELESVLTEFELGWWGSGGVGRTRDVRRFCS
jgi:hypothetical protein